MFTFSVLTPFFKQKTDNALTGHDRSELQCTKSTVSQLESREWRYIKQSTD